MSNEQKSKLTSSALVGLVALLFGMWLNQIFDTDLKDTVDEIAVSVTAINMRMETQFTDINGELVRITSYQNRNYDRLNNLDTDVNDLNRRVSVIESKEELRGIR